MFRIAATFRRLLREQGGWGSVWVPLAVTIALGGATVYVVAQQGAPTPPGTARLWLSTSGTSSCTRNANPVDYATAVSSGNVCSTWQKAYDTAADGDTVLVQDGTYSPDGSLGGTRYFDSDTVHSNPVTFACPSASSSETVNFTGFEFTIRHANGLRITGRCFLFVIVWVGEGSDNPAGVRVSNVTLDNVHMSSFDVTGGQNVTISNSNIGPGVSCHNQSWGTASQRCQSGTPWPESYYYAQNIDSTCGNCEPTNQPTLKGNSTGITPTGFTFTGNYLHDFQSRDSTKHPGCFQDQAGGTLNLTFSGNVVERCASQGIFFDNNDVPIGYSNVTIENNFFGYAVEPYYNGFNCCTEAATSQRDLKVKQGGGSTTSPLANWLVRYNSFTHGFDLQSAQPFVFSNVRVYGNIAGKDSVCRGGSGITYNRNVWAGGSCGDASSVTSFPWTGNGPYQAYSEGSTQNTGWTPTANFHLGTGPFSFENWISETTSDYAIATDYDQQTRSVPRTAGADQR